MTDVVGFAGLVVGLAALILPFCIERLKRPRLEIELVPWQPSGPVYQMTFASAQVHNRSIRGPLARFLDRNAAEACEVTIDFFTWTDEPSRKRVFSPIKGRWDSHRQPIEMTPVASSRGVSAGWADANLPASFRATSYPGTQPTSLPGTVPVSEWGGLGAGYSSNTTASVMWHVEYVPSLDTTQQDISVGSDRGQISVAILRDGRAFAFANESYETPNLCKPEWELAMGETYRIEISVKGSNVDHKQVFKLEYVTNKFDLFKLHTVS